MRTRTPRVRRPLVGATAVVAFVAMACGASGSRIVASRARVPIPANPSVAALYVDLDNEGDAADVLERVEVDTEGTTAQLHETVIDERGVATMRPQEGVAVPAGQTVAFGPGKLHVMVLRPPALAVGETLGFTLHFREAGPVKVRATVTEEAEP